MAYFLSECTADMAEGKGQSNKLAQSRILVVDDNHELVVTLSHMLHVLGLRIDSANCGPAALRCLDRSPYDLVLTDLEMPGMSGYALAGEIKEKWSRTRVVIMTGRVREEFESMMQAGIADDWLLKPFSLSVLETVLSQAICKGLDA